MNLATIIEGHPDDDPALITATGEVTTYGQLRRQVVGLQRRLGEWGIGPGDRVALLSANHPLFAVGYLAVLRAGAVAVPLNTASPLAELKRELEPVDPAAILVGPGASELARAIESATGVRTVRLATEVPEHAEAEGQGETQSTEVAGDSEAAVVDRGASDVATLLFTAGTAGTPKAAMLTHGNLLANLGQVQAHPGWEMHRADRVLAVLPLCHVFGLNTVLGGALSAGAAVVLLDRFEPAGTLAAIIGHGITILVGAPALFGALTAAAAAVRAAPDRAQAGPAPAGGASGSADEVFATSIRLAVSGAAPLPSEVAERWKKRFGLPLRQGYGLTEAAPVVSAELADRVARRSSVGVTVPGVEVRLLDDEGDEALAGDPGELWVRGPNVFPGYWHDEAATRAVLTPDGWLRTGDIAVVGDDGELSIVDRAKDLIIVSGFNVYPAEVEEVLAEHPAVTDIAVVGDDDPVRGEAVHAYVVVNPKAGTPTTAELDAWCAARLARYKCPTAISFVPTLPHGLAGKLLRRSLRSQKAAG